MGITHAFVSSKSQSGDSSIVSKNEWNADHDMGGLLTTSEALCTADTALTNPGDIYDITGVSLSLGAGTYLLLWSAVVTSSTASETSFRLWNGTTIYDEQVVSAGFANAFPMPIAGHRVVTFGGTTTVKLSALRSNDGGVTVNKDTGATTTHTSTKLTALRIG